MRRLDLELLANEHLQVLRRAMESVAFGHTVQAYASAVASNRGRGGGGTRLGSARAVRPEAVPARLLRRCRAWKGVYARPCVAARGICAPRPERRDLRSRLLRDRTPRLEGSAPTRARVGAARASDPV